MLFTENHSDLFFPGILLLKKLEMESTDIYNLLPIEDKIEVLMSRGEFIESYETYDHETWLYSLDGQYIELTYSIPFNRIEEVKILMDYEGLLVYIHSIDISKILKAA
jgi:hypothetical protein